MVNEKEIESFLNRIRDDVAFAEKVLNTEDPEKVIVFAENAGIIISVDDLMEIKATLTNSIEKNSSEELSEKDLESVAGGISNFSTNPLLDQMGKPIIDRIFQVITAWKW